MTIQLTLEQHQSLIENGTSPVHAIDPVSNTEYVLLNAETYRQIQSLIDDDFQTSDAYPAVARAVAHLWDDPKMDDI